LICATLPHYGVQNPWSHLPIDDLLLWGLSGAAFAQFAWEDVPVQLVTPQLRYAHGMLAAGAISAALVERARTGSGQHVDISGLHAVASIQSGSAIRGDQPPRRRGRGARGTAPNYKLYRCADGNWLFLATLMAHHFRAALEAIELDVLQMDGVDGEFQNVMKPGVGGRVRERMEQRFAERDCADWLERLHAAGVPSGPVGTRSDWFDSETVAANKMRVRLEHDQLGPVDVVGVSALLSEHPGQVRHLMRSVSLDDLQAESAARRDHAAISHTPRAAERAGPLAGVRVLDLGVIIAAPFASTLLANFGADVIKVEPLGGDSFRPYGLGFVGYNQGKRSIVIDLKSAEGLETFRELVRHSDVVCDNYRVGVLERLGIDDAALRAINPRIITVSITAFGSTGAKAADPGFDPLLQALSGLMAAQGGDDEPVFHQIPVHDTASAMVACFATCAALFARERTGRGQHIETSLASQSVLCQSAELTHYAGRPPAATGSRDCPGVRALARFYPCADGWLALSCQSPHHVAALRSALGDADPLADAGPDANETALLEAPSGALAAQLGDLWKGTARAETCARLATAGVPCAPVTTLADMPAHPLHVANGFFESIVHPRLGPLTAARGFAEFSETPGGFRRPAPELGEHTVEVLSEIGLTPERIQQLIKSRAIGAPEMEQT